jgi:S1-C subfamily serine protease
MGERPHGAWHRGGDPRVPGWAFRDGGAAGDGVADLDAIGRDIYGDSRVRREIIALSASVERGDSGGPFVTSDGLVGGVVFAGDPSGGTAYALTVDEVRPAVEEAIRRNQEVGVGACRF